MRVLPQDGAWYTDCLPSGEWVSVIFGSHIESSWGRINFLPGLTPTQNEPLFVRLNNDGTAFAGQSHGLPTPHPDNDKPVEYQTVTGEWAKIPKVTVGTNPVIYNSGNVLVIATAGDAPGSQGYGYVSKGGLFPAGQIVTGDQCIAPTAQVPGLWRWVEFAPGLFVGQGADENGINGGVLFYDGTKHRVVAEGRCRNIRARQEGDVVAIGYYEELEGGGYRGFPTFTTVAELKALPELPEPVPVKPIGPLGPPLPEGTWINVADFFALDDRCWPRGNTAHGDDHGMDMQAVTKDGEPCLWYAKFGAIGKGRAGELLSVDADPEGYIHWRGDCSNAGDAITDGKVDLPSDTRWLRKRMQIGRRYALDVGWHKLRVVRRSDGGLIHEIDFNREQWIVAGWDRFWLGADFGEGRAIRYCYNNTGQREGHGTGHPGHFVETYYMGIAADGRVVSWGDWTADPSTAVFATTSAVFPDPPHDHKDFWHLGGQRFPPDLPSFPMPIAVPPEPSMKIPLSIQTTMQAFAGRFPLPMGGDEVVMHDWSRRMAEQVKFSHNTGTTDWGLKSTSPGSPTSNNITLRDSTGIHTWDYIVGSAAPNPRLNIAGAEYFFIPNQNFIPVQAIDHLGAPVQPSKFPPLVLPFWGASAFDLAARVSAPVNDWRYYEELRRRKLKPRIQCYATINHPATGRLYRDFGTGLAQLRTLLPRMAADGMQGQFTYLVGTTPDGVSRSEAINRIRQLDALVCSFPTVVAGRQGVNESPYPGLEEPYTSEDGFWREVEAILDPRFPWTRWANHGGAPVNMSGGSYFVHHSNRDLTPDQAGEILGAAQKFGRGNVVDDEPRRFEAGGSGQATGDLNFVRGLIANAKKHGYGLTLHNAAGRGCSVDLLSDLERQALDLMAAEVGTGPTPFPPPTGHPILDAKLSPALPTGYHFFIANGDAILTEADAWYRRAHGHSPARTDLWHGVWRGLYEGERWLTLRNAWQDTWPGGAP